MIKKIQEEDNKAEQELLKYIEKPISSNCEICMDGIVHDDMYPLNQCGYIFHYHCISHYVELKIKDRSFPIVCPNLKCKMGLSEMDVRNLIEGNLLNDFYKFTLQKFAEVNNKDMSFCPTPDCKYLFVYDSRADSGDFTCPSCQNRYCLNCRCAYHVGMSCKEYKINSQTSEEDKQFLQFAKGNKFKQCPQCKFWVERTEV